MDNMDQMKPNIKDNIKYDIRNNKKKNLKYAIIADKKENIKDNFNDAFTDNIKEINNGIKDNIKYNHTQNIVGNKDTSSEHLHFSPVISIIQYLIHITCYYPCILLYWFICVLCSKAMEGSYWPTAV